MLAPVLCFALLLCSYTTKGHLIPGDAQSHLGRSWLTLDALRHGELPVWSNRWYMGFPLDLYYGPLFHFTAALFVGLLGGKLFFAGKLLLWIAHVGSAMAAYRLGLSRYDERSAALVLATGYALAGYQPRRAAH
ncbi:MAG TPA: hypothetical protein VMF89_36090 [Polyangiales bacterium]|nr:hypothetical protein [Polyangiales bacterium]